MASAKNRALKYNNQCKILIKCVTGFDETDENFQTCLDFALSNLLYHSYRDVNSHAVKEKISRIHERFLIQSDLEKAEKLLSVTSKLINIFENKFGSEKESFSVLALLLLLWESGDKTCNYGKNQVSSVSRSGEESWNFDWTLYLREDDINCNSFSDDSSELSLSEHSSTNDCPSEEDSLENLPDPLLRPPTRDDSGLGISPDSCSGTSQHFHLPAPFHECAVASSKSEKNPLTFHPYWISQYQKSYGSSPYNLITMNFTKMWNDHIANKNLSSLIEKKVVLHERNIVKEILWMLCGVKELFVAHWDGRKFVPNSQIHLTNLTSNTLYLVLNEFCGYGTKQALLQDFLYKDLLDGSHHCRTYRAYTHSMQELLREVRDSISTFDKRLRMGGESFTLLSLKCTLKPLFHKIDLLHNVHVQVTTSTSDVEEPFIKACTTLHVLWKLLYDRSLMEQNSSSLRTLLKIFLKTCRPYFAFMEEFIILGSFKDPHEEFLVKREDKKPTDETFWESGYSLRPLPRDLERGFFLSTFVSDIQCAGKSLEILNTISFLHMEEPFRVHAVKGDMYSKFIHILQMLICKHPPKRPSKDDQQLDNDAKSEPCDPLLEQPLFDFSSATAKFFRPDVNPAYRRVLPRTPERLCTEQHEETERIVKELELTRLKPVPLSILKALSTCMEFAYYPLCRRLIRSLKDDHCVIAHLVVMRKYFLMESGDLMFSFYSEIFQKVFYQQKWVDASFLYSALQNAIFEDKENSEKLRISVDLENPEINSRQPLTNLSALRLSYEVDWPVSIMLGPKVQTEYCQIFSFLLQIKGAKYLLDNLYCTSLCQPQPCAPSQLGRAWCRTKFPREQKSHGMHIFRMRLMFFVNGFHNYIMTRILYSFGLEFTRVLEDSRTVDEMMDAHARYLKSLQERCLLDRRISYLREQIFQVLHLCHAFQQLWIKGIDKISLEDLQDLEGKFSTYCNFLFCCFNTPLRRGTYLHVESLVSSMLPSTHSLHVFGGKE